MIHIVDLDGRIVEANQTELEMMEYTRDEYLGKPLEEIIHPQLLQQALKMFKRVLSGENIRQYETILISKSGREIMVEVNAAPLFKGDDITGAFAIIRDITERKQMENALKDSEKKFRNLFEQSQFSIFIHDPDGVILNVNPKAEEVFGYSRSWLLNRNIRELIPDMSLKIYKDQAQRIIRDGFVQYELEFRNSSHGIFPGEVYASIHKMNDHNLIQMQVLDISKRRIIENALQKKEKQFLLLMDTALDAIVGIDHKGRIILWNRSAERTFGYSKEDVMGQLLHELIVPERYRQNVQKNMRKLWKTGKGMVAGRTVILKSLHKSGEEFPVELSVSVMQYEDQWCAIGIIRDITERIQEDEKRRRLEACIEQAKETVVITDTESRIQYVNPAFVEITGYSAQEVAGKKINLLKSGKHTPEFYANLWETITSGKTWEGEFINRRKDGSLYIERAVISPVKDDRDRIINFIAVKLDITQRRKMEEETKKLLQQQTLINKLTLRLGESKELDAIYETLYSYIRDLMDADIFVIYYYEKGHQQVRTCFAMTEERECDISIYPPTELDENDDSRLKEVITTRKPLYIADHQKTAHKVKRSLQKKGEACVRSSVTVPMKVMRSVLGIIQVQSYRKSAYEENDIELLQGIANVAAIAFQNTLLYKNIHKELKERKLIQKELQMHRDHLEELVKDRTEDLESFTYSVSHDLRAPIRAIDGFINIFLESYEKKLDEEGKHLLQRVVESAHHMSHLIDDLLKISRLGRREMTPLPVNMDGLVEEVISSVKMQTGNKKMEWIVHPLPSATCDPGMIRQVWENYISNAVKYTGKESVPRIEIGSNESDVEYIYFVKDNGIGFKMEYADQIFTVFQRLVKKDEFEGTGVGLAIVRRIIQKHNGRVWAEGKEGEGATLYFSLPKIFFRKYS